MFVMQLPIFNQCSQKIAVVIVVLFCEVFLHIDGSTNAYPPKSQSVNLVTSPDSSFP